MSRTPSPASDCQRREQALDGGLDWSPGDRVVIPDGEFSSTLYPFLALQDRGVIVDRIPPYG